MQADRFDWLAWRVQTAGQAVDRLNPPFGEASRAWGYAGLLAPMAETMGCRPGDPPPAGRSLWKAGRVELSEARARVGRLEAVAGEVEWVRGECANVAVAVGCVVLPVTIRLEPGVWAGPAAERAFAGMQAASLQAGRGRREVEALGSMVVVAVDVARRVAAELRQAIVVAEEAGLPLVEDRFAAWPSDRLPPRGPDPEPSPQVDVPPPPGGVAGYVGIDLDAAGFLVADLRRVADTTCGIGQALAGVLGTVRPAFEGLVRDVAGFPRVCHDLGWLRVEERLRLVGEWAQRTREDLAWRMAAVGGAGALTGGMATATLVFADAATAERTTAADVDAIERIIDRRPFRVGGVTHVRTEDIRDVAAWLERTAGRASDTAYAAKVLNRLGPGGVTEALDLAARGGPDALGEMGELIAAATRSGTLDDKTEAALLAHPHLRLLAVGDARFSPAFARAATDALLDPGRLPLDDHLAARPHRDDLEAARHLMETYGTGPGTDPAALAALAGGVPLSAALVAEMLRLAVISDTNQAAAAETFGEVLRGIGPCSKESKRVLAEAAVAHLDDLVRTMDVGGAQRTATREALHALMADREARQTLIEGAGALAGERLGSVCTDLAAALAANPGDVTAAFGQLHGRSDYLKEAGSLLQTLAEWPGEKASQIPGLLAHGFTLFMAGAGTVATGGGMGIVLTAVGASGGEVFDAARDSAAGTVEHRRKLHVDNIRDVAHHVAITSLLMTPTDPPLWDLLVDVPPTGEGFSKLIVDGDFAIPPPGTEEWRTLQDWIDRNPKLSEAVEALLDRVSPGAFG